MTWQWFNERAPLTKFALAATAVFGSLYVLGTFGVPNMNFLALVIAAVVIVSLYQNRGTE